MQTPRNFLFISYYFPPVKVVGAVRLFHFSEELAQRGIGVFVVTCRNRKYFRQDPGLRPSVEHIRTVPAWDWRSLRLRWTGGSSPTAPPGVKKTGWGRWLARAQESFPLHFLLGDGGPVYLLFAYVRAARLIRARSITHVFTSYRPYADLWVGYLLKLRFPHLHWIADFRDLHVDPVRRNVLWPRLQNRIDRRLLRHADLTTTVSEGLAVHLPAPPGRLHVLRNAVPAGFLDRRPERTSNFIITYTGSIYPEQQDALPLFRAVAMLIKEGLVDAGRLQLVYMGKDGGIWDEWLAEAGLAGCNRNRAEQDREAVLRSQCQSSLNVLLSWSTPELQGVLTSKVYEYLSAGAPILALVNGPRDAELERIVEETGGGSLFYSSPDQVSRLRHYLLRRYREWMETGATKSEVDRERLRAFSWPAQTEGFLDKV